MGIDGRDLTHDKSVTHSHREVANRRHRNDASSPVLAQKEKPAKV